MTTSVSHRICQMKGDNVIDVLQILCFTVGLVGRGCKVLCESVQALSLEVLEVDIYIHRFWIYFGNWHILLWTLWLSMIYAILINFRKLYCLLISLPRCPHPHFLYTINTFVIMKNMFQRWVFSVVAFNFETLYAIGQFLLTLYFFLIGQFLILPPHKKWTMNLQRR
jgi:hypothetical protein